MTKNNSSIAVIGCGWLGLPFAKHMISQGFSIKGTTTKQDKLSSLKAMGIEPFLYDMHNDDSLDSVLSDVDFLVLNVPPGRRDAEKLKAYPVAIRRIMQRAKQSKQLKKTIFVSSTSVYGFSEQPIDEAVIPLPETASGLAILDAEQVIIETGSYIILRFGGLAGPGRHPGRFLAGRKGVSGAFQSINFLHLSDAMRVIEHLINSEEIDQIFNVVAPIHPTKQQFYASMAKSANVEAPSFEESNKEKNKEIDVQKLLDQTGFTFEYPDPMNFRF